ncbi:hypothetical protein ABZ746_23225 [Streptomyces sp. NPDC020096]
MMSSRRSTALYVAAAAVMIALLVLVWSRPAVGLAAVPRSHTATATDRSGDACSAVIGPAKEYCTSNASSPASPTAMAPVGNTTSGQGAVLMLAAVGVATAIGLAMLAERRAR